MATKKSKAEKSANSTQLASSLLASAWQNLWELADDTRAEWHKQSGALISVVDGALRGATSYASNLNDRADHLAKEAVIAASQGGIQLASAAQSTAQTLLRSSRSNAAQVVSSTREGARDVASRANATVLAIVTPAKAA